MIIKGQIWQDHARPMNNSELINFLKRIIFFLFFKKGAAREGKKILIDERPSSSKKEICMANDRFSPVINIRRWLECCEGYLTKMSTQIDSVHGCRGCYRAVFYESMETVSRVTDTLMRFYDINCTTHGSLLGAFIGRLSCTWVILWLISVISRKNASYYMIYLGWWTVFFWLLSKINNFIFQRIQLNCTA